MSRRYTLRRRAERQDETRERIVDAAIGLHQTIGPTATTVSEIAERAGVGRATVYRHFPDELALARACSGKYLRHHPPPDPEAWRAMAGVEERLGAALRDTYAYHRATRRMFSHVLADARDHPVMVPYHEHWRRAVDVILEPLPARARRPMRLRAAVALALSFDTWRTLCQEHALTDARAARLMAGLVRGELPAG